MSRGPTTFRNAQSNAGSNEISNVYGIGTLIRAGAVMAGIAGANDNSFSWKIVEGAGLA
ncbi:hypothetical protein ACFQ14_05820 [Pseudahrensia aquimaris]|uniref:Uncharacterized protein n=1 Tax=Pseudahrensia aquimaris TaxID=744461 RepID=A0ABW3FEN5_9HYPH